MMTCLHFVVQHIHEAVVTIRRLVGRVEVLPIQLAVFVVEEVVVWVCV